MSAKSQPKYSYKGEPFQIRWEISTKEAFKALCADYDKQLSMNGGIRKLLDFAIDNHWLPGYERKVRKVIETGIDPRRGIFPIDKPN